MFSALIKYYFSWSSVLKLASFGSRPTFAEGSHAA
jgi:hypothetical protein